MAVPRPMAILRQPVLFKPAHRLEHEGGRSRKHRPSWWSNSHDGCAEQVFPEDQYASGAVTILEHRPRHRSRRGYAGRRRYANHAPTRSEHGIPHQVHPSRPTAVRFAKDSGRVSRNALYQIGLWIPRAKPHSPDRICSRKTLHQGHWTFRTVRRLPS